MTDEESKLALRWLCAKWKDQLTLFTADPSSNKEENGPTQQGMLFY